MTESASPDLVQVYIEKRLNLLRYFTLRLNSPAAAEDILQDIYVRLATADIGAVDNPTAFLYRLGTNLMLDRVKQQRRAQIRDDAWHSSRSTRAGGEDVVDDPPADEVVSGRQRLEKLMVALEQLPQQRKTAFRLHKLEGLSHAATAATMGISRSAVEKHIIAALRQLLPLVRE